MSHALVVISSWRRKFKLNGQIMVGSVWDVSKGAEVTPCLD